MSSSSNSRPPSAQQQLQEPPNTTTSHHHKNNNLNSSSPPRTIESDKFQIFERWLRINGAQFPLLELRKYDSPTKNKNEDEDHLRASDSRLLDSDNEAEEKKDAGGGGGGGGGILQDGSTEGAVAMMSLDGSSSSSSKTRHSHKTNNMATTTTTTTQQQQEDEDDGSKEMRGVHAKTTIPPQTTVVSIPKSCLITVEMGQSTPIGRKILQSDLELDAPKHIFLMIYLLWDRKLHGPSSFFAPYYDILPQSLRNMPLFWNDDELAQLEGSHLLVQIADRAEAIREDYDTICGIAPEFADIASLEEFQWARMIVCSRNFGLLINGHRTSALVPHADMLNHYRPRETKWTFCEETQCFTITTLQSIGRGAQVYDSYGQKCNHRFLLNYGFCVERNVEIDGFCPNEVPLELGMDLIVGSGGGGDRGECCWEKKLAFWSRGENHTSHHLFTSEQQQQQQGGVGGAGSGGGVGSSFQALAAAVAGASSTKGTATTTAVMSTMTTDIIQNMTSMTDASTTAALTEAIAAASSTNAPLLPRRAVCPIKRVRVCVSNNENTRILFSMLRVLACNSSELDRITVGGRLSGSNIGGTSSSSFYSGGPSSTAQRLFGVPSAGVVGGTSSTSSPPSSSSLLRTCRDIRYPINLRNERRAMELLLELTARSLSKYPTSLAQDTADLLLGDNGGSSSSTSPFTAAAADLYPKYSNIRNAKLQVRGEKEVLHHFALWARTAMHVIDIILHELEVERKLIVVGGAGAGSASSGNSFAGSIRGFGAAASVGLNNQNGELGYDYVIQAMEEEDDCHSTILRYCSDVLGAVRRDELNRIAANVLGGSSA